MTNNEHRRAPMTVAVANIKPSTWNVHAADTNEDLHALAESIRANGMIHRIVLRQTGNDTYEIIDGHRRFEAAKLIGMDAVPCELISGITDEDAQAMTITANIQRIENDPILEAALIERLADAGKTYEQIAAVIGTDTKHVARRARICNLTEKWRTWLRGQHADADIMEYIAAHEQDLQNTVYDSMNPNEDDGYITEESIRRAFTHRLRDLKCCGFDTNAAGCASCPFNTATHGWLFATDDEQTKTLCENADCYTTHHNNAVDTEIEKLRKKGITVKQTQNKWNIPNSWSCTARKSKANTQPWVYMDGQLKMLTWSKPNEDKAAPAKTEAEKAEEKRIKKAHSAWKKHRNAAYAKLRTALNDANTRHDIVHAIVHAPDFLERAAGEYDRKWSSYAYDSDLQQIYETLRAEALEDLGCAPLHPEEINALMHSDPALNQADAYVADTYL